MDFVLYLLLICFGAYLLIATFHFVIWLQQKDNAYLHYSLYLFNMTVFTVVRILDERLTQFFPLDYNTVATLDSLIANLSYLMYVNFLGVVLNISKGDSFFFKSWRVIQYFIIASLIVFSVLMWLHYVQIATVLINFVSFASMSYGSILVFRLFKFVKDPFYKMIIIGTIILVIGVFGGLIINVIVLNDRLAFEGLIPFNLAMLIEVIFLSSALGYRLKMAYMDRQKAQEELLEESKKNQLLAEQTAALLKKELNIINMQNRISKDLHDDIGASLSSIQIYTGVAQRVLDEQPEKVRNILERISENSRNVMENMSDIVWAMHTDESKSNSSISDRIRNYGFDLLSPANMNCEYEFEFSSESKDINLRKNLLLIVKESFNNIAKYSSAKNVHLKIWGNKNLLQLRISDDGIGFDIATVRMGNGIANMKSRVEKMNGSFTIESTLGQGTIISVSMPIFKN